MPQDHLNGADIHQAIIDEGGSDAVNLRIAEQYIGEFGNLAKEGNTMIIPTDLSDIAGMVRSATSVIQGTAKPPAAAK